MAQITDRQIALLASRIDMPAAWGRMDLPEVHDVLDVSEDEGQKLWREYETAHQDRVRDAVAQYCSPETARQVIEALHLSDA